MPCVCRCAVASVACSFWVILFILILLLPMRNVTYRTEHRRTEFDGAIVLNFVVKSFPHFSISISLVSCEKLECSRRIEGQKMLKKEKQATENVYMGAARTERKSMSTFQLALIFRIHCAIYQMPETAGTLCAMLQCIFCVLRSEFAAVCRLSAAVGRSAVELSARAGWTACFVPLDTCALPTLFQLQKFPSVFIFSNRRPWLSPATHFNGVVCACRR